MTAAMWLPQPHQVVLSVNWVHTMSALGRFGFNRPRRNGKRVVAGVLSEGGGGKAMRRDILQVVQVAFRHTVTD